MKMLMYSERICKICFFSCFGLEDIFLRDEHIFIKTLITPEFSANRKKPIFKMIFLKLSVAVNAGMFQLLQNFQLGKHEFFNVETHLENFYLDRITKKKNVLKMFALSVRVV